jgi:hypothetical protein
VHLHLKDFAHKLFKDAGLEDEAFPNSQDTYYIAPGLGKLNLSTGGFFPEGEGMPLQKTDVIKLWQEIKGRTFIEAFNDIKAWVTELEEQIAAGNASARWEEQLRGAKETVSDAIFADGEPDVQTGSAKHFLDKMMSFYGEDAYCPSVKTFASLLRRWSNDRNRLVKHRVDGRDGGVLGRGS